MWSTYGGRVRLRSFLRLPPSHMAPGLRSATGFVRRAIAPRFKQFQGLGLVTSQSCQLGLPPVEALLRYPNALETPMRWKPYLPCCPGYDDLSPFMFVHHLHRRVSPLGDHPY